MKPIISSITFCLFSYFAVYGQELIPNPGFDDVNICHKYHEPCSPKAWRSTSLKLVGYDYGLVSVLFYDKARNFDRKFIQTDLLCPLQKNVEYVLKMKIRPDKFRINQLGVLFTDDLIFSRNNKNFENQETDLDFVLPPQIKEKEWIVLEQLYTARGGEQSIIIGNFLTDSATQVTPIDPEAYEIYKKGYKPKMRVHYTIDSVSLMINTIVESDTLTAAETELLAKDGEKVISDSGMVMSLGMDEKEELEMEMLSGGGEYMDCDLELNRIRIYKDSIRHSFGRIIPENISTPKE